MPSNDILIELHTLVREQLNAFDEARSRSFSQAEAEQYAWRKEQIRILLAELESKVALSERTPIRPHVSVRSAKDTQGPKSLARSTADHAPFVTRFVEITASCATKP
jgi:hypothetical protein